MAAISTALIASLIAAAVAAAGYGTTAGVGTGVTGAKSRDARSNARSILSGADGLSDADLNYILDQYTDFNDADGWQTFINPSHWFSSGIRDKDLREDLASYLSAREFIGDRPADVDYAAIADSANSAIDAENAQVLSLYDQMLGRSNGLFQQEMDANNEAFRDYMNQVQTNNAMATQSIAGSTRYEMDRARRNAIQRGASAAQRLTASVNAQLGLQNRAAQQQLETSNQLASALLQQRQAAAQLRGDYVSNLNSDAANRAGLIAGTAERKAGLRNSYYSEAEARHQAETDQWKDRLSGYLGDSPFYDAYNRSQSRKAQSTRSTYGL